MSKAVDSISRSSKQRISALDNRIIDRLQAGIEVTERPFLALAETLGIDEPALIERLRVLLDEGMLSRFGPMFNADAIGGAYCLCAMSVPGQDFDTVSAAVNAYPEVAHNYARDHALNMWFVVACEHQPQIAEVIRQIESDTGLIVLDFPKEEEYYIGLHLNPRAARGSHV